MKKIIDPIFRISLLLFNLLFRHLKKEVKKNVYQINKDIKLKVRPMSTDLFVVSEVFFIQEYTRRFKINPNDTVVDLGAHIGSFSVFASKKAVLGKVFAYEPSPENFKYLTENKKLNSLSNLLIFNYAVAGSKRNLNLYINEGDSGENSIYKTDAVKSIKISAVSLPQIFEENKISKIDFLKIDVEGAEYEILLNTPKKYLNKIEKIAMEYHDNVAPKHNHEELKKFLEKNSFEVEVVNIPLLRNIYHTGLLFAQNSPC